MDKCHSLTNKNVSVGKLLWYEKNITVQDMVLLENIYHHINIYQLCGGKMPFFVLGHITSIPITVHSVRFYSWYNYYCCYSLNNTHYVVPLNVPLLFNLHYYIHIKYIYLQ